MSNMLRAPRAASKALRSNSSSSLDIVSSSQLPPGKLPSVKNVLQLICSHREQPKGYNKRISDLYCSSNTASKQARCFQEGGCIESGKPCLLFQVKKPFLMAGFLPLSDQTIERHLKNVNDEHKAVVKLKGKSTPGAETRKAKFQEEILKTFDILNPNVRNIVPETLLRMIQIEVRKLERKTGVSILRYFVGNLLRKNSYF